MTLLHTARLATRKLGLEVTRANPMTVWYRRLPALLAKYGFQTVLDVGAHDGGFATELLNNGYQGTVISFEPLPGAHARLSAASERFGSRWKVADRIALSDVEGEAMFHEAGNGVSSSLMPISPTHVDAAPASVTVANLPVPVMRLDTWAEAHPIGRHSYLKIDVQGAERLVLAGAGQLLDDTIDGVQVELSLDSLYAGQASAEDIDHSLRDRGFKLWDIVPGFRDARTFKLLQYDGVYLRDSVPATPGA